MNVGTGGGVELGGKGVGDGDKEGWGVTRDLRLSWPGNHIFLLCQTKELSSKTISLGAISTDTSSQLTHFSTFFTETKHKLHNIQSNSKVFFPIGYKACKKANK